MKKKSLRILSLIVAIVMVVAMLPLSALAEETGYSERYINRTFKESMGISPKKFARIIRFQSAIQGFEAGLNPTEIAYQLNYYDFARMVKEKKLSAIEFEDFGEFLKVTDGEYDIMNIPDDKMGVDIGEKSIQLFEEALKDVKTVIWNGPMGVFEVPHFAEGTKQIAKTLAEMDAITIIGGGDSAAAVNELGYGDKMTLISTGGGASLEFLEGKELPGITAIQDK